MNQTAKQLVAVIKYWQKKCSIVHFEMDGDLDGFGWDYRNSCQCISIDKSETKLPYPTPMRVVMQYLIDLLDLENRAVNDIDAEDPNIYSYEFEFNFSEMNFKVTCNYSYTTEGDEIVSMRNTKNDEVLTEVLNDLKKNGKKGKYQVTFNGSGDSGYIDDNMSSLERSEADKIPSGLEDELYDFLGARHPGWENNEGSFGSFIIDLNKNSIELYYTENYEESDSVMIHMSSINELIQTITSSDDNNY